MFSLSAGAGERSAEDLERLRGRLETLERGLERTRAERDQARAALAAAEREIGRHLAELRTLKARAGSERTRLTALRARAALRRAQLATERHELTRSLRLQQALGRPAPLRLLLSPHDPPALARVQRYYHYLLSARLGRIQAARSALAEHEALERQIAQQLESLERLQRSELEHRRRLEGSRAERARAHERLTAQLRGQTQEIGRLRQDEQALRELVQTLSRPPRPAPAVAPVAPVAPGTRFAERRGQLPLPARGRIAARYGETRGAGDLKWKGIFLAAPEGQEVRAVHAGRVAYADWLRGLGLLLVLEHDNGYMTLYGHNQSLYKTVGERVEAGQAIASTGTTGGAARSGLYFEIRHHGQPHDPLRWCKVQ
jgi:septal ring factor EnvC (AmiA/AmiB activator)